MMKRSHGFVLPLLVMGVGCAWLLNTMNLIAGVDWLWSGALAFVGMATLLVAKFSKVGFVMGFFCLLASVASVLRQSGRLTLNYEVPLLVIALGVLMLLARLLNLSENGGGDAAAGGNDDDDTPEN